MNTPIHPQHAAAIRDAYRAQRPDDRPAGARCHGYDIERATDRFQSIADARHPKATYLIDVLERDARDVSRFDVHYGTVGEQWTMTPAALAAVTDTWTFSVIESVGFTADELADMLADGELDDDQADAARLAIAELEQETA